MWLQKSLITYVACVVSHFSLVQLCEPYGLEPARLLCPWYSPGKNTGVGWHFFLHYYAICSSIISLCILLYVTPIYVTRNNFYVDDYNPISRSEWPTLGRYLYLCLAHILLDCLNFANFSNLNPLG